MAGEKILIADDDLDILDLFSNRLKTAGYEVTSVSCGVDVLEKLDDFIPDLMILDLMMAQMDGYTVLKTIRKYDETKSIPIIVLTGYEQMEGLLKSEGVDDFIVKPSDSQEFLMKVKNVLEKYKKNP